MRLNRKATTPGHAIDNSLRGDRAKAEYIRIGRALIGATPAQLAAHIGARRDLPSVLAATEPAQTPERLEAVLRVVVGWYGEQTASAPGLDDINPPAPANDATDGLDELVRKYINLRAAWESREAVRLAAEVDEGVRRGTSAVANAPDARAEMSLAGAASTRRRALLVDDVSDVIVTVGAFLESFGFDVLRASNADLALQILADGARMDLLVTDHAMPGMTGRDLAVQACLRRPMLRALIITGYPGAEDLATLPAGVLMLAKPFRRAEFFACIDRLFGRTPEPQNIDAERVMVRMD